MKTMISPSILSADFGHLAEDVEMINRSEADWIHVDVMDGVFVPNISFGFPVIKAVSKVAKKPLDVHLMIVEPEKFIPQVKAMGAYVMNVHYEACPHLHRVVQQISRSRYATGSNIESGYSCQLIEGYCFRIIYGAAYGSKSRIRGTEIYWTHGRKSA